MAWANPAPQQSYRVRPALQPAGGEVAGISFPVLLDTPSMPIVSVPEVPDLSVGFAGPDMPSTPVQELGSLAELLTAVLAAMLVRHRSATFPSLIGHPGTAWSHT